MKEFSRILVIAILLYPSLLFGEEKVLTIVHTNDLHSHLLGFSPNVDYTPLRTGDDQTVGGWARIATVIKSEKSKRTNPTLVLDAGDFLMGSLFHMVAREEALELRLMKEMGYDVVTPGNHEFDLMPRGLARILASAHQKGRMPEVVSSNLIFGQESKEVNLRSGKMNLAVHGLAARTRQQEDARVLPVRVVDDDLPQVVPDPRRECGHRPLRGRFLEGPVP